MFISARKYRTYPRGAEGVGWGGMKLDGMARGAKSVVGSEIRTKTAVILSREAGFLLQGLVKLSV